MVFNSQMWIDTCRVVRYNQDKFDIESTSGAVAVSQIMASSIYNSCVQNGLIPKLDKHE